MTVTSGSRPPPTALAVNCTLEPSPHDSSTQRMAVANAAHLVRLLARDPYPGPDASEEDT